MSILYNSENAFMDLQLFSEGTGAAGAASDGGNAGTGETGANAQDAAVQSGAGAVPAADNNAAREAVPEDRNKTFEKLISEDYADLFNARVKDIVSKRLSKSNETVEKYKTLKPYLDMLGKRYNVDPNDLSALTKAMDEDDAYYEKEAIESGMSIETVKKIHRIERENAEYKRRAEESAREEAAQKTYETWMKQAEEAKRVYPSLDLAVEIRNPDFASLIRNNIDVRTAYEVIHKDDIISGAMQFTAKKVEQKLANKIAANGQRPVENAAGQSPASTTKTSIKNMPKDQFYDLIRRAANGEHITLG